MFGVVFLLVFFALAFGNYSVYPEVKESETEDEFNLGPNVRSFNSDPVCTGTPESTHSTANAHYDLMKTEQEPNFFSTLYDGISTGISKAYNSANSAKDHLYTKLTDVTYIFAEKVRKILKEELLDLMGDNFVNLFKKFTAPG